MNNAPMILIRLGELTLKGRNRSRFERSILKQLETRLGRYKKLGWTHSHGRIFIALNGEPFEPVAEQIGKTFGIMSFSPVDRAPLELDAIRACALAAMRRLNRTAGTFKVSVRRPNKQFPHTSQEMNRLVGGYLLRHLQGWKVDVHQPDVELQVEIRQDYAYVFCEVIPGPGGYPAGTSGKAMLLLSGGIDSPVAGWMAMKRGLELEAVHFHSFPYTSERAQLKVRELAAKLAEYAGEITLHMVPFTDIQLRLKEQVKETLLITYMRRAMLRIAETLAERRGAKAIVTGDSLGQVASQTLPSLTVIGRAAELPILRPLIMLDKQEIIDQAKKIGTYPISIQPYEDCCTLFVPRSPSTNPNLHIVERLERKLDWLPDLVREAADRTETSQVRPAAEEATELDRFF